MSTGDRPSLADELDRAARCRPVVGPSTTTGRRMSDTERVSIAELQADWKDQPLRSLLGLRRSERRFRRPPLDAVAAVLVAGARVLAEGRADDGYLRTWRPYPSAGGRHPIDLLVVAADVDGLAPGAWWFDAWKCELAREAAVDLTSTVRNVESIVDSSVPAIVFAVAVPDRTLERYPDGMSLVWRDAGVVLQTLHVLAFDAGLASCILGTTAVVIRDRTMCDVGGLALGLPDESLDRTPIVAHGERTPSSNFER
jgi:SagB-type dehydrogenase family enzyme